MASIATTTNDDDGVWSIDIVELQPHDKMVASSYGTCCRDGIIIESIDSSIVDINIIASHKSFFFIAFAIVKS
eukprot:5344251-Ditylum_brightwellii.AAC.1